jgi:hypothetical protein
VTVRSRVGFVAVAAVLTMAACGERTISIVVPDGNGTVPVVVPTATAPSAPTAAPLYVCTAVSLGATGQWAQAEEHWITDETKPGELQATFAFLQLGEDAGAIALDQYENKPIANDVATYNADLSGDGAYTVGC